MAIKMKKKVRTYSATDAEVDMLSALAEYHGFSKSGTITNLIKKEFWRVYPSGNETIKPGQYARVITQEEQGAKRN